MYFKVLVITCYALLLIECKKKKLSGEVDGKVINDEKELVDNLGIFGMDLSHSPKIKPDSPKPKSFKVKYTALRSDAFKGSMLKFLADYGYVEAVKKKTKSEMEKYGMLVDEKEGVAALKKFQKLYGLKASGELDEKTIRLIASPRCANKDVFYEEDEYDEATLQRSKRYALSRRKWLKEDLFYWYDPEKMTKDIDESKVKQIIEQALGMWAGIGKVNFNETLSKDKADIQISFVFGNHGDGYPFTGEGQSLAHAFYPTKGLIHFDDAERFTDGVSSGINLKFTAVHEFGHVLGIKHSSVRGAVMFPYYPGYSDSIKFHEDDENAVEQAIGLGSGIVVPVKDNDKTKEPTVGPTELPDNPPDCWERIDGVLRYEGRTTIVYVFSGHWYFRLKPLDPLKNNYLPVYDTSVAPKLIKIGFTGVPSNIDSVIPGSRSNKNIAYFTKKDRVYEFSFDKNKVVKEYSMSEFFKQASSLPEFLDGGWKIKNTRTGFLSNSSYYVYDDVTGKITGPKKSYFDTKNQRIDAVSQTFYNVWTWIFQGKYYGIGKSTTGQYSRGREYRPIKKDLQIPMCPEEVGALTDGEKKNCKKEFKKVKNGVRNFRPSLMCYNYIEKLLTANHGKLSNVI